MRETAHVVCKIEAYPKPDFQWSFGGTLLSDNSHYQVNTTQLPNDIYESVLVIGSVRESDYGDYVCRVGNSMGYLKTAIKLQPKGAPEHPTKLEAIDFGSNFVTLQWKAGFNGGLHNTQYFVTYRKQKAPDQLIDCPLFVFGGRPDHTEGQFDCQRNNPCNVTLLEQHHSYSFKVSS